MAVLRDIDLVRASVLDTATFVEAAQALFEAGISAIAVVDREDRVVGVFTDDDLLGGIFPHYLRELRHTAFLRKESEALGATLEKARGEPIRRYLRKSVSVDVESSDVHVAERFLHCPWGALAVVENSRFVGMVDQVHFVEELMRRLARRAT